MIELHGLLEMAAKLGEIALAQHEVEHHALEKAAKLVEKRAKEKIGEYQEQTGPFIAWPELADSTKEDRLKQRYTENDPGLRSGEMRDSIEHQVHTPEAHVGSDDDNLVWFELGTSKQPPRSVLGGAAVEKLPEILEIVGESATAALAGKGVHGGRMLLEND
jgi:hypothetical protein